jgi:hypothetical protein
MVADRGDGLERLVMAACGGRCGLRRVLEGLAGCTGGLVSNLSLSANPSPLRPICAKPFLYKYRRARANSPPATHRRQLAMDTLANRWQLRGPRRPGLFPNEHDFGFRWFSRKSTSSLMDLRKNAPTQV